MAIRSILTAACLMAPLVAGFVPASVHQQTAVTTNWVTAAPRVAAESTFALRAVSDVGTDTGKIYDSKEAPKVLGGVKIGLKKLVVVTGASSGLGLATTIALSRTGKYHIIMACRDIEKAKRGEYVKAMMQWWTFPDFCRFEFCRKMHGMNRELFYFSSLSLTYEYLPIHFYRSDSRPGKWLGQEYLHLHEARTCQSSIRS